MTLQEQINSILTEYELYQQHLEESIGISRLWLVADTKTAERVLIVKACQELAKKLTSSEIEQINLVLVDIIEIVNELKELLDSNGFLTGTIFENELKKDEKELISKIDNLNPLLINNQTIRDYLQKTQEFQKLMLIYLAEVNSTYEFILSPDSESSKVMIDYIEGIEVVPERVILLGNSKLNNDENSDDQLTDNLNLELGVRGAINRISQITILGTGIDEKYEEVVLKDLEVLLGEYFYKIAEFVTKQISQVGLSWAETQENAKAMFPDFSQVVKLSLAKSKNFRGNYEQLDITELINLDDFLVYKIIPSKVNVFEKVILQGKNSLEIMLFDPKKDNFIEVARATNVISDQARKEVMLIVEGESANNDDPDLWLFEHGQPAIYNHLHRVQETNRLAYSWDNHVEQIISEEIID